MKQETAALRDFHPAYVGSGQQLAIGLSRRAPAIIDQNRSERSSRISSTVVVDDRLDRRHRTHSAMVLASSKVVLEIETQASRNR
jgi:hypothetical protein